MKHLKEASLTRPSISLAIFGPVKWTFSKKDEWTTTYIESGDDAGGDSDLAPGMLTDVSKVASSIAINHTAATIPDDLLIRYVPNEI
jgi:hypothetical protein